MMTREMFTQVGSTRLMKETSVRTSIVLLLQVSFICGLLTLGGKPAASQEPGGVAAGTRIVRDATAELRIKSLHEEFARDVYQTSRPFLSRWIGLGVFLILCSILIAFLDRSLKQREHLRKIGFFDDA